VDGLEKRGGRGSAAFYRAIFDHSADAILISDLLGGISMANPAACQLLRHTEEDICRLGRAGIVETWPDAAVIAADRVEHGQASGEVTFVRGDGTCFPGEVVTSQFDDQDGQVRVVVAIRDLTERKHAQAVLAASQAALTARVEELQRATMLLQRAQALAGLATFRIDLDLQVITLSPELSDMYGIGVHELVLPLAEYRARFYHPDDLVPKTADAELSYQRGADLFLAARVVRGDGSMIWVRSTSTVLQDPDGTSRVLGVVQDVTEQVRSRERDRLLATLVESSDDAMITLDPAGYITSWNPGAERLYGYSGIEMLGQHISRIAGQASDPQMAAEEVDRLDDRMRRIAAGQTLRNQVLRRRRKDGTPFVMEASAAPLHDDEGRVVGTSLVGHEITDRMLLQEKVDAALAEAVRASTMKSQLIANTTHELMTPLTIVLGMTELLLEMELGDAQWAVAERVAAAAGNLRSLIQNMLDLARSVEGAVDLDPSVVRVRAAIGEIDGTLRAAAEQKGLTFVCQCDADVPAEVHADPARLSQVLTILTGNAVKFTDRGGVVLRASRPDGVEPPVVRFTVADTGIGIASADRRHVFSSFWQADMSSTRRHGGAGLGLALAAEIVEAMRGTIGFDSEPGRGSTFWFQIPTG
jgi:PAS domain S-box-containing protein